jgi:hypothetical protein
MSKRQYYDWSSLDRDMLVKILGPARKDIVEKSINGEKFTKIIRTCIRNAGLPISVKSFYNKDAPYNHTWIGGVYESYKDKKNQKSITISLHYKSKTDKLYFSYPKFKKTSTNIADTILHEVIHARQYRRRNYKYIPGYESTAQSSKQRSEQEYLGHNDEIDAYAFNIACDLSDQFENNKEILKHINSDFSDKRLKDSTYRMYMKAFDFDHNHKVIKKLKKKIIHYLPYVSLGKPYKTSDWLKW